VESFSQRIGTYLESRPWLVCETEGRIAGYAYAGRHRERACYQWSTESSVYVHDAFMGNGIAGTLYKALLEILKYQGFRNVYAVINLPNDRSVRFHEKHGFTWFADYRNVGYKLGLWKTVGWWQRNINDYSDHPAPPLELRNIDPALLDQLIRNSQAENEV
jgi:phosphinothricin acetyltransferase